MNIRSKIIVAATAAVLSVGGTAHAYKLNDDLELNLKLFANVISVEDNSDQNGFHPTRGYLEVRRHIGDTDMLRLTLDQKKEADTAAVINAGPDSAVTKADGRVFVKYAYWQHTFPFGVTMKVGQAHTPFVDYDESHFWGYRFVSTTFVDTWGLQTSSDNGLSLLGKAAGGMFEYYLSVLNGEGYQHTADGNGYAFAARVQANVSGFHLGVLSHDEGNRNGDSTYDPTRRLVFAFYGNDMFRLGGQYLWDADDGQGPTGKFYQATGYNLQGLVNLPTGDTKTSIFARYDSIDPQDTGVDQTLTIAGVSVEAAKGITLAPNVQIADNGTTSVTTYGIHAQFKF